MVNLSLFLKLLCKICFVRIQIVWFHSQFVGYITKYLFNLLYFLNVLLHFIVGSGSGQFDRIQIRPKGSDPSGSRSATLLLNPDPGTVL